MTEVIQNIPPVTSFEVEIIRADGTRIPLGVISHSEWKWYSPGKWAAWYRIQKANRQGSKT